MYKCWENPRGKLQGDLTRMRTESTYKSLWIFFLICCSTFSFLPNMGLRLTLEYITHDSSLVPPFTHLYGTRLKSPSGRLSIQGQTVLAQAANHRL